MLIKNKNTFLVIITVFYLLIACGKKKEPKKIKGFGPVSSAIMTASDDHGLNDRVLLSVAYVQSQFMSEQHVLELDKETSKNNIFGLKLAKDAKINAKDNYEISSYFAKKMLTYASRQPTNDNFDWISIAAKVIVGDLITDKNLSESYIKILVKNITLAYNSGFISYLPQHETIMLSPLPQEQKIDLKHLEAWQTRYIVSKNPTITASADVEVKQRSMQNFKLKIVLRGCSTNIIRCIEYFKNSNTHPVHFIFFKDSDFGMDYIQLHEPSKDLLWENQELTDTISIAIVGFPAPIAASFVPDYFQWEEYVSMVQMIKSILSAQLPASDLARLNEVDFLKNIIVENLNFKGTIYEANDSLGLPFYWDTELFWKLMGIPYLHKATNAINMDEDLKGKTFNKSRVEYDLYPDPDVSEIHFFQDNIYGTPGKIWDLVLKQDYDSKQGQVNFSYDFRKMGIRRNKSRSMKVLAFDEKGNVVGYKVVTFQISALNSRD